MARPASGGGQKHLPEKIAPAGPGDRHPRRPLV